MRAALQLRLRHEIVPERESGAGLGRETLAEPVPGERAAATRAGRGRRGEEKRRSCCGDRRRTDDSDDHGRFSFRPRQMQRTAELDYLAVSSGDEGWANRWRAVAIGLPVEEEKCA